MKNFVTGAALILLFGAFMQPLCAQAVEQEEQDWKGVVRFKPLYYIGLGIMFSNPVDAPRPDVSSVLPVLDIVPRVSKEFSIPITIDAGKGIGLEAGVEFTPVASLSPGGLIFSVQGGLQLRHQSGYTTYYKTPYFDSLGYPIIAISQVIAPFWYLADIARLSFGYQFLSTSGVIVRIALGALYSGYIQLNSRDPIYPGAWVFDLTLDLGFAYQ